MRFRRQICNYFLERDLTFGQDLNDLFQTIYPLAMRFRRHTNNGLISYSANANVIQLNYQFP